MAKNLDLSEFGGTPQLDLSEFQTEPPKPSGAIRRIADAGISLAKGVVGVPEAAVGLADLVTGGQAGKLVESAGVRFKDAKAVMDEYYSPEQKAANAAVQQAEGFVPTVKSMVQNPSTIVGSVMESAPSMGVGGVAARGALKVLPKMGAIAAGALGEGVVTAGQNAEQVRQEDANGTLTGEQSAILGASGMLTGAISLGSGKLANKLGIGDVQTMLASGKLGPVGEKAIAAGAEKGLIRKMAEGFANEGVLQELPQSYQEQVAQNLAQNKPWDEGAAKAGAQGMLTGALMGGGANVVSHFAEKAPNQQTPPPVQTPVADPLQLGNTPDPLISFKDGTVARQSEVDAYLNGLPEAEQSAARAKLIGLGPQVVDEAPAAAPAPVVKPSETMGLNAAAGPISAAAVTAVDSGVHQEMQLQDATAADQAAYEQATTAQQAQAAEQDTANQPITHGKIPESALSDEDKRAILFSNQTVGDGGRRYTGTQDGDILNGEGKPYSTRFAAARRANMEGKDWTIAPVFDGFVARRKDANEQSNGVQSNDSASTGSGRPDATASVGLEPVAGNGVEADTGGQSSPVLGESDQLPAGADAGAVTEATNVQDAAPAQPEAGNGASVQEGAKAPEVVASTATPANDVPGAGSASVEGAGVEPEWWRSLTGSQRVFRLKASGIKGTAMTPWNRIPTDSQSALNEQWGPKNPAYSDKLKTEAKSPEAPANPAQAATNSIAITKENDNAQTTEAVQAETQRPEAPAAPPVKKGVRAKIEEARQARADYFTPGNIVQGYSGNDRVISYKAPDAKGEGWNVTVQAVVKQDGQWVVDPKDTRQRNHSTQPDAKALKSGPVERAQSTPVEQASDRTIDGFKAGDVVDVHNRTINGWTVKEVFMAPSPLGANEPWTGRATVVSPAGKELEVLSLELRKPSGKDKAPTKPITELSESTKARNLLMELQAQQDANGMVGDDRLETQINQVKREIKAMDGADGQQDELDAETRSYEAKANPTYSGEPAAVDPDFEAAKALLAAQKKATGNPTEEAKVRKQLRDLAGKVQDGSKASSALDIAATRLGMGEGKLKGLEYAEPAKAPEAPKPDALSEKEKAAKAKMFNALGKLAALASKNTRMNWTPEEEQQLLPIVIELFDGAMDLGSVTFQKAVRYVREFISANLDKETADAIPFETLQGAYIHTARKFKDQGATPGKEVMSFDSLEELEKSGDQADTGTKEPKNEPATNDAGVGGRNSDEVQGAQGQRGASAQQPDARTDSGDVEAGQPGNVEQSLSPDADGAAGLRGAGGNVGAQEGADASGPAGDGRPGAGGKGNADAGARSGAAGSGRPSRGGKSGTRGKTGTVKDPATVSPANTGPGDFVLDDPLKIVGGGQVARFDKNKSSIELRNLLMDEGRPPTREEQAVLAGYTGWGSFGQELFKGNWSRSEPKPGWEARDKWLRENLGQKEWEGLQTSIINAHFTDPPTVLAMWDMVRKMGFTGGRTLEPSIGIGNFYGMMPVDMVGRSQRAGIELDPVTGSMAQMLYPNANIQIKGYEESKTPDNFYDLVIGNWPFFEHGPADRRYNRLSPTLHDYFFLKAIDQTRPGGLVVGITSKGTMDKKGLGARMEMARKAELVAAFRLPTGAFAEYAGTAVVTDIIILRKREAPIGIVANEGWIEVKEHDTKEGTKVFVNEYFHKNPTHVVGEIDFGHGTTSFQPGLIVHRPDNMMEQLKRIAGLVPDGAFKADQTGKHIAYVANHTSDRTNSLIDTPQGLFVVRGEYLAPANEVQKYTLKDEKKTAKREAELKSLIDMRKLYGALIDSEHKGDPEAARTALATAYEAFGKAHGQLSNSFGLSYLEKIDDPFYPSLAALEIETTGADGKKAYRPAAILSASTMRGAKSLENPSITDAFVLSRNEVVNPSLARIAELAKTTVEDVKAKLLDTGAGFELPNGDFAPSDVYLSGNVRAKMREARAALESGNAAMDSNIAALEKVMPADVPYYKIETQMGATWVPSSTYSDFVAHMLGLKDTNGIDVGFKAGSWKIDFPPELNHRAEASSGFGSAFVKFKRLVRAAIANQTINVKRKDSDGNEYIDQEQTKEVNGKIADMRMKFGEWLWGNPTRRAALESEYNEVRNAYATPRFDGSFLGFQGMALTLGRGPFQLRQHQVNAIWRAIVTRKSLNAHEVGTGKTFTMGGIAVESRRYGIAKKPMLFAHNANSKSVAAEIQMMYPSAKVLYVDNMSRENVKTRMMQIANDDWDVIVLPHSLIDSIGFKEETLMNMAQEELADLELAANEAADEDGVKITSDMWDNEEELAKLRSVTAKQLVKQRLKILTTIRKLAQQASKEGSVAFEDLGVDMLLVDEAHEFKKPPIATKMNMKGLQTSTSDRSIAMMFLTKYVRSMNNGANVHLFTGTPITNTMTEVFHMMRYMMQEEMKDASLADWDGWFGSFAREVDDVELTSTGEYEAVTRLQSFINVPELRRMIGQYMDVVFSDDMPEMKPREINGKTMADKTLTEAERGQLLNGRTENAQDRPYKKVVNESSDMSPEQASVFAQVQGYANTWKNMTKKERKEAMTQGAPESPIIHDGIAAKASFDVRLVDGIANAGKEGSDELAPHESSKAARTIKNLLEIYRGNTQAGQVVFMSMGMAKTVSRREGPIGMKRSVTYPSFSTMQDMIERLVQAGIPREQIAAVDGGTSKDKRKEIADKMNTGEIRIVFGSTGSLGVGVNMQRNLRAMHHMDAPWMPGDLEQRNGRGHRQGNQWNTVLEYRYITDRLDGKRWQVLARKQRFITDFMKSKGDARVIEGDSSEGDSDILSTFAEAAGDPRVLIREKMKKGLEQLRSRERLHSIAQADAARDVGSAGRDINSYGKQLADLRASGSVELATKLLDSQRGDGFRMGVNGKDYAARSEAIEALHKFVADEVRIGDDKVVGTYGGEVLRIEWDKLSPEPTLYMKLGGMTFEGMSASINSLDYDLRAHRDKAESKIVANMERAHQRMNHAKDVANEPFHMQDKLNKTVQQLADLEHDIAMNPVAPPYWLRNGAPMDTEVMRNGKSYTVTGHRWANDGWFVMAQDEKGDTAIPYMEAMDPQGMPLYEEHDFEAPTIAGQNARASAQTNASKAPKAVDFVAPATNINQTGALEGNTTDVVFSARDSSPAKELPIGFIQTLVKAALRGIPNAPTIEVFANPAAAGLNAPSDVVVSGAVTADGRIYVFQSGVGSAIDVQRVIFHELFHKGLQNAMAPEVYEAAMLEFAAGDARLQQLAIDWKNTNAGQAQRQGMKDRGLTGSALTARFEALAIEEGMAGIAEELKAERAMGTKTMRLRKVATWLAKLADKMGLTRFADAIRAMSYTEAEKFVMDTIGKSGGKGPGGGTRLKATDAAKSDQTDTPAFKAWFGDSKVVDAQGKPLVVYHGSKTAGITEFNTNAESNDGERGTFFSAKKSATEDYGSSLYESYLSIKTPYEVTSKQWAMGEGMTPVEARKAGHDGYIIRGLDGKGGDAFMAFNPTQIKSATGNNGDFDTNNPDIRFSIADTLNGAANNVRGVKLPAGYLVGDLIGATPGKMNWWHKTVGTQYNLSTKSKAFKRVFDGVQNFINDVSYFATEAADMAPNILPKLETWKDIAKSPLSAADTKAISAPIFEGTLIWGRDESGKAVKMEVLEAQAAKLSVDQKAQRLLRGDHISEQVLKMWRGMQLDQYEAAITGKYERDMLKGGIVFTPAELKSLFNLSDNQVKLYQEFRKATDKSLSNLAIADMLRFAGEDAAPIREAVLESKSVNEAADTIAEYLRSMADGDRGDVLRDTADKVIDKGNKAHDLTQRGYAPLSRFGQYTLDVVHEGERVYFGLFESKMDAAKMNRQMAAQFPGAQITQGTVSEQAYKMFSGVSPETLELFGDMLGLEAQGDDVSAKAFQEYLKLAKSSRSAMKRLLHRKGIAGFNEDAGRVLAGFVYSNARQTSSSLHMGEMTQAAADKEAFRNQGELQDAAVKLVDYIKNPQEEAQKLRGLLFAQFIGGSVASAMVNMTQPLTMSLPWLVQFGGITAASKQMANAVRDVGKKKTGDDKLDAALRRAEEDGTVSPQEVHQLMQQSMGKGALQSGDGTLAGNAIAHTQNAVSRLSLVWGKLFSVAEQFNRRVTFIAAYRTAIAQGMKDPDGFARRAISETQGIYNKGNKPAWARGAIGATLFTFKQYSVAYVEMLGRMAKNGHEGKKSALLALGILFLLSGAGGMPGADDLDDLISGLLQSMGYNFDSRSKRQAFFVELLGEGGAQFMERGISGLPGVPIDVSGRMGLGNLIPGTGLFTKKQDHTRDVAELAGPAGDLIKRGFESAGKLIAGDVMGKSGAVATLAPKAAQNLYQAVDMATMGMYRDAQGKKVLDTSGMDAFVKGLGFQPNDVKQVQDANYEVQRMIGLNRMKESEIANRWAMGLFEKDPAKVQAARADLADWNQTNPESPIRINFAQIADRLKKMNATKSERIAKTSPKEIRAAVQRELAAAR